MDKLEGKAELQLVVVAERKVPKGRVGGKVKPVTVEVAVLVVKHSRLVRLSHHPVKKRRPAEGPHTAKGAGVLVEGVEVLVVLKGHLAEVATPTGWQNLVGKDEGEAVGGVEGHGA